MNNNRKWLGLLVAAGLFGTSAVMAQQGQGAGYPGTGQGSGSQGGAGMQSGGGTGSIPQGDAGMERGSQSQGERATPTGRQPGSTSGSGMQRRGPGTQGEAGMQRGGAQSQGERATPTGGPPGSPSASMYETGPFKQGDRLPTAYRDRQYVIDNYQAYDLPRPPRGQRWVGVGGDYMLVTGDWRVVRVHSGGK
ncbi:nickel/cobalt transporter regulator [Cupriavidus gilardii J11]|uniref:Nickel/cobalt transporter regulator n=1 Tax=Cupriavidus gilardii J11 TaxID=936133 RepID=A0A562BC97_9BURK|nr:nickel/cobalt transporter regulator [Cupriavidus gilardii J11]